MTELRQFDLYADPDQLRLGGLIEWARAELADLERVVPAATEAQWTAPPRVQPADDTPQRSKGIHSDPTPSIALSDHRLRLRDQVISSERLLRETIVALRGVRIGLERSLSAWEVSG